MLNIKNIFSKLPNTNYFKYTALYSKKAETSLSKAFVQKYLESDLPDASLETKLKPIKLKIAEQAAQIRKLKKENGSKDEISKLVKEMETHKSRFQNEINHLISKEESPIDVEKLSEVLKRRFFYDQSFSIYYGSPGGFYDLGPIGCAIQNNMINEWRKFFVIKQNILEIDCAIVTPENVLKASGHLTKFNDFMVKDLITNEAFRVDHLLKAELENRLKKSPKSSDLEDMEIALKKLENSQLSLTEIDGLINKLGIKSPNTGNALGKVEPFNLMFQTSVGPTGTIKGYLRPETAQGIFCNFKSLFRFNQNKLPLKVAQVGKSFRNEINPKSGLIRQREFLMAEIEHFIDPLDKCKQLKNFQSVENFELNLLSSEIQLKNSSEPLKIRLKDAVDKGIIKTQIIAFYLGKIYEFCKNCGIDEKKMRFRQHLSNEMAHYAEDCWDLECHTSFGWIECVGLADRSNFDLTQHANHSGQLLNLDKQANEKAEEIEGDETVIPHVIEPSFGIARLIYTILEHNFKYRGSDKNRSFFTIPASIAPFKCSIMPLVNKAELESFVDEIENILVENEISFRVDKHSGSIGKKYARSDEIAIPYVITVDFESLKEPKSITIRDRDSMQQIRVPISEVAQVLNKLISMKQSWNDMTKYYNILNTDST